MVLYFIAQMASKLASTTSGLRTGKAQKKDGTKSSDFMHCKDPKELAAALVAAGYQCPKNTWDLPGMRQYAKLQGVNFVPDGVVVAKASAASRIQDAWRKFMTQRLVEFLKGRKDDAARAKASREQAKADAAADKAASKAAAEAERKHELAARTAAEALGTGDALGALGPGGRRLLRPTVCRVHIEKVALPDRVAKSASATWSPATAATGPAATAAGWGARDTLAGVPGQQRLHPPKVAINSPAAPSRYLAARYQGEARSPSPENNGRGGGNVGRTPLPTRHAHAWLSPPASAGAAHVEYLCPLQVGLETVRAQPEIASDRVDHYSHSAEAAVGSGTSAGPAARPASTPPPRVLYRPTSPKGFNSRNGPSPSGGGPGSSDGAAGDPFGAVVLRFEDGFGTQLPGVPCGMLADARVGDRMRRDHRFAVTGPVSHGGGSGRGGGAHGGAAAAKAAAAARAGALVPAATTGAPSRSRSRPQSAASRQAELAESWLAASPHRALGEPYLRPRSPGLRGREARGRSRSPPAGLPTTASQVEPFAAAAALSPRQRADALAVKVRAFVKPPGEALAALQQEQAQHTRRWASGVSASAGRQRQCECTGTGSVGIGTDGGDEACPPQSPERPHGAPLQPRVALLRTPPCVLRALPVWPWSAPVLSPGRPRKASAAAAPPANRAAVAVSSGATAVVALEPPTSPEAVVTCAGPEAAWVQGAPPPWAELRRLRACERSARCQHASLLEVQFASDAELRHGVSGATPAAPSALLQAAPSAAWASPGPTTTHEPKGSRSHNNRQPKGSRRTPKRPLSAAIVPPRSPLERVRLSSAEHGMEEWELLARGDPTNHHEGAFRRQASGRREAQRAAAAPSMDLKAPGPQTWDPAAVESSPPSPLPLSQAAAAGGGERGGSLSGGSSGGLVGGGDPFEAASRRAEAAAASRQAVAAEGARLLAELQQAERRARRHSKDTNRPHGDGPQQRQPGVPAQSHGSAEPSARTDARAQAPRCILVSVQGIHSGSPSSSFLPK